MHYLLLKARALKPAWMLIYLSSMGFLCVLSVQMYMQLKFEPVICLCSMGLVFGIYTSNRFTDTAEDLTNDIEKALFFQRRSLFFALAIVSLVGSIAVLLALEKLNWLHFLLVGVGIAYSYRLIPWYYPSRGMVFLRIKEMTFVKNLSVSFLWGGAVFAVPILYSSTRVNQTFVLLHLSLGLFLSTLNNTLFDDVLDEAGDRIAGIKTLPTLWGSRNSLWLLWTLDVIWIGWVAVCFTTHRLDMAHSIFLAFLGAYPFLYTGIYNRFKPAKGVMDLLTESDLLLFSMGLMLLSAR